MLDFSFFLLLLKTDGTEAMYTSHDSKSCDDTF